MQIFSGKKMGITTNDPHQPILNKLNSFSNIQLYGLNNRIIPLIQLY